MTDFLSRLVERSETPAVPLPVVAPLFAAGPAVAPAAAIAEPEPAEATPRPGRQSVARVPPSQGAATVERPAPPGERAGGTADREAAGPAAPAPVLSRRAARADRIADGAPVLGDTGPVASRRAGPGEARRVRDAAAATPPVSAGEQRVRPEPPARVLPPAQPLRPAGCDPPPHPAAPPVVRISIGRIEVRAVTGPAPASPRPAPAPKPSGIVLEEYLRPRGRDR